MSIISTGLDHFSTSCDEFPAPSYLHFWPCFPGSLPRHPSWLYIYNFIRSGPIFASFRQIFDIFSPTSLLCVTIGHLCSLYWLYVHDFITSGPNFDFLGQFFALSLAFFSLLGILSFSHLCFHSSCVYNFTGSGPNFGLLGQNFIFSCSRFSPSSLFPCPMALVGSIATISSGLVCRPTDVQKGRHGIRLFHKL